jgi:hypothetical protein
VSSDRGSLNIPSLSNRDMCFKFVVTTITGLFHSHLGRLRMNSESNSESRLKTTETHVILTDFSYEPVTSVPGGSKLP